MRGRIDEPAEPAAENVREFCADGEEFWVRILEAHGEEKGFEIGGDYLTAQLKNSDKGEQQFCHELLSAMCETRGFEPKHVVYPNGYYTAAKQVEIALFKDSLERNEQCLAAMERLLSDSGNDVDMVAMTLIGEFGFDRVNQINSQILKNDGLDVAVCYLDLELDAQRFTLPAYGGSDVYGDYDLYRSVEFDDGHGFAMGCSGGDSERYAVFSFTEKDGWEREYAEPQEFRGERAALDEFNF